MILRRALACSDSDALTAVRHQLWRAGTSDEPSNMVNGSLNSSLTGKRRFGHVIFSLLPVLKIPITQHLQLTGQGLLFPPSTGNMQTVKSEETPLKPRLIALVIFNDFEMYWPHYGTVQLSIPLIRWCAPIRNLTLKHKTELVRGIQCSNHGIWGKFKILHFWFCFCFFKSTLLPPSPDFSLEPGVWACFLFPLGVEPSVAPFMTPVCFSVAKCVLVLHKVDQGPREERKWIVYNQRL